MNQLGRLGTGGCRVKAIGLVILTGWMSLCLLASEVSLNHQAPSPPRTLTVAEALRDPKKFARARVALRGRLVLGKEIAYFEDGSACSGRGAVPCKLAISLEGCVVTNGADEKSGCGAVVSALAAQLRQTSGAPSSVAIEGVVITGLLSTKRRDVTYDKSMKSLPRVGFGHLGIFPGEILATSLEFAPER